jgi:hypothetical protein
MVLVREFQKGKRKGLVGEGPHASWALSAAAVAWGRKTTDSKSAKPRVYIYI